MYIIIYVIYAVSAVAERMPGWWWGGGYVLQGYLEGTVDVVIRVLSAEIHNFQRSPLSPPFS